MRIQAKQVTGEPRQGFAESRRGTIRLFLFSGIEVFLHWSWFLLQFSIGCGGLDAMSEWTAAQGYALKN
jgi:hypothetical protein